MVRAIGFVGLGAMGRPMAKNIVSKSGCQVIVYDMNPKAVEELALVGALAAQSAAELAAASDIIITMLPNSPDVEAAVLGVNGILEGLKPGSILIDMSTIDPAVTRKVALAIEAKKGRMIDAPVGRTTANAEAGTLMIMVGGDEDVFNECKPTLSCMGNDIIYCGLIGAGATVKIINNLLTGIIVAANAEVLTLGVKAGLELNTMLQVLRSTNANNGHLNVTFPDKALKRDFTPGFATRLAHKDLNLALNLASQLNVPLYLGSASAQLFSMAKALGHDHDDYTSVIQVMEKFACIEVR